MASSIVQSATGNASFASTVSATFASNVTAGNTIVVIAGAVSLSTNVNSISGSTDSYTVIDSTIDGPFAGGDAWGAYNSVGGYKTVTVTLGNITTSAIIILEVAGVNVVPLDTHNVATVTSSSTPTSPSITTTYAQEGLIGWAVSNTTTTLSAGTDGAGNNFGGLVTSTNGTLTVASEFLYEPTAGSYSASFGSTATIKFFAGVLALKPTILPSSLGGTRLMMGI